MSGTQHKPEKRLLCEGWLDEGCEGAAGLVEYPSAAYFVADDKVWFARGDASMLGESLDALLESEGGTRTIVESMEELPLEERQLPDGTTVKLPKGPLYVEGVFQRSDVPNANKRVYPRGIWERLIADKDSYVQKNIAERGMLGHLEHPSDGRTDGKEGALVVVEVGLQKDGTVIGKAEVLDTPNGLILKEYTRKGVRWGVSSRGNGKVEDGKVDESTFVLETWDAVMKPSVPGAYPKMPGSKLTNSEESGEPVTEGTWGKPHTVAAAKQLQRAMRRPIPAGNVPKEVSNVVGDDDLFDLIDDTAKKDGEDKDVRVLIASQLLDWLRDLSSWSKPWEPAAIAIYKQIALKHGVALSGADKKMLRESNTATMTESLADRVLALTECDPTSLAPSEGLSRFRETVTLLGECLDEHGLDVFGDSEGRRLLDLMHRYQQALSGEQDPDLDQRIDEALAALDEGDRETANGGFERVVASLRQQLADAHAEADGLREQREQAESASITAQEQLDECIEQLSEVEAQLEARSRELGLAEGLLARRTDDRDVAALTTAIDEVVSEVPGLDAFRDVLGRCSDAADVRGLAERLLPAVTSSRSIEESEESAEPNRPTAWSLMGLSDLDLVSEEDAGERVEESAPPAEVPRVASVALQAAGAMGGRRAPEGT